MDSVPLVCISGQVPTHLIGTDAFQECDTTGITRPCTKHNWLVKDIKELPKVMHEAFKVATTGRPGPVLIDIPKDIQFAKTSQSKFKKEKKLNGKIHNKFSENEINPDSIRFNFDTQKALIWNSKSSQNDMDIFAALTKKENDSVYFLKNAKMTTSQNEKNPDYYIRISKGKMVPGKKIVAGFTNLYIADIPTPVALPFAYFPTTQNRQSGFIFPTIGESNERGYYLQSLGYYLPLSRYFDLNILGDYYTNGSYGLRFDTQYKVCLLYTSPSPRDRG